MGFSFCTSQYDSNYTHLISNNRFLWAGVETWGGQFSQLLAYAVMARYLKPDEFGLYAFANIFFVSLRSIAAVTFVDSLVQKKISLTPLIHTLFWIIVGLFIFFIPVCAGLGHILERPLQMPGLGPVLSLLSLGFLAFGFSVVPEAICIEQLHFRPLALRRLIEQVVGGITGVAGAMAGFGTYSLVWQVLIGSATGTLLLWSFVRFSPRFTFDLSGLSDFNSFFFHRLGSASVAAFGQRIDSFFVGSLLGPAALGYYSVAWRINTIAIMFTNAAFSRFTFPLFVSRREDPALFRLSFRKCVHVATLLGGLGFFCLLSLAHPLLITVFGPAWMPAVPVLQGLALFGLWANGIFLAQNALRALGHADVELRYVLFNNIAVFVLVPLLALKGLVWVPFALIIGGFLATPYLLSRLKKLSGITPRQILVHAFRPWLAGLIAASGTWIWLHSLSWVTNQLPVIQLATGGALFVLIYLTTLLLIDRFFIFSLFTKERHSA